MIIKIREFKPSVCIFCTDKTDYLVYLFCYTHTPIHCKLLPKQNPQKLQHHFYSLINAHKEPKTTGGDVHKGAERPRPSPSFVSHNSRSRSSCCCCRLQEKFETILFSSLELPVCGPGGRRGGRRWQCTKPKAHFARSVWSGHPLSSSRSAAMRGGACGPKVEEDGF